MDYVYAVTQSQSDSCVTMGYYSTLEKAELQYNDFIGEIDIVDDELVMKEVDLGRHFIKSVSFFETDDDGYLRLNFAIEKIKVM